MLTLLWLWLALACANGDVSSVSYYNYKSNIPPEGTQPAAYRDQSNSFSQYPATAKKITHETCVTIQSVETDPSSTGAYSSSLVVAVSNVTDKGGQKNPFEKTVGPQDLDVSLTNFASQTSVTVSFPPTRLCFPNTPSVLQFSLLISRSSSVPYTDPSKYDIASTTDMSLGNRKITTRTQATINFKLEEFPLKKFKVAGTALESGLIESPNGDDPSSIPGFLLAVLSFSGLALVLLVIACIWGYRGFNRRAYEDIKAPPPIERISLSLDGSGAPTDVRRTFQRTPRHMHERTPLSSGSTLDSAQNYMATYRTPDSS